MKITLLKALEICKKEFSKDPSTCFHANYNSDYYMKYCLDQHKTDPHKAHPQVIDRYDSHWELKFNQTESLQEDPEVIHIIHSLDDTDHLYVYDNGDVVTFTQTIEANEISSYKRFIEIIRETKVVWGLKADKGWANCESKEYEDCQVMPFFSHESYAKANAIFEWQDYEPAKIDLDHFIRNLLKGMHEDEHLVGVNWDNMIGSEVEPFDLAEDLTKNP